MSSLGAGTTRDEQIAASVLSRAPKLRDGDMLIEYVAGERPYLRVERKGVYVGAVDVKVLREFLKGRRS